PVVMSDLDSWTTGHGLGVELFRLGERVCLGHGGSMPGYVAALGVHRRSRTGVVAFANAYGLRDSSIGWVATEAFRAVLDGEPVAPPAPWRPATAPADPAAAELCGRWWWMGREYEVGWDADRSELVFTLLRPAGAVPWRFTREGADRWRGRSGQQDGEILTVLRDGTGAVDALDIATFVFTRDPDREP
ncbi:MAG TPA: serine hydrolase, partial [Micromonospora sp.]